MTSFSGIEPFVRTADLRSFRAAAQSLGISPAAVSKSVAALEQRLDVRLLNRTSRRVSLTPEGAEFLAHCRSALDHLDAGQRALARSREQVSGTLRASISRVLEQPVTRALPTLRAAHPDLHLDLRFSDRYAGLLADEVDVAVRIGHLADSTLIARRLRATWWRLVASPEYARAHGLPAHPAELRDHTCLRFRSPEGVLTPWVFVLDPKEDPTLLDVPAQICMDSGVALVNAAIAGAGITHAFDFLVDDLVASGALIDVLLPFMAPGPPIHAVMTEGRQRTPNLRVFVDFLAQALA